MDTGMTEFEMEMAWDRQEGAALGVGAYPTQAPEACKRHKEKKSTEEPEMRREKMKPSERERGETPVKREPVCGCV